MTIEEFKDITIAYMQRTGEYGFQNKILMENFKTYLTQNNLLTHDNIILEIALHNPANTDTTKFRYDVGIIVNQNQKTALCTRKVPNGI